MTNATATATGGQSLDQSVGQWVAWGWRVESRTDSQAVMVKGHRPNHILHLILSIVTVGLWVPVWIGISIFAGEKRKVITT